METRTGKTSTPRCSSTKTRTSKLSNFKPEFLGKPEEDAEAHLLHSNDWMDAHHFNEDIKVQRFCLTLLGEARLWYHSVEPLGDTTWAQLQNLFRQRYSKLGNTCEQLFHAWRSFTFDENTETIDSYVIRIRQVVTLLGYGELQILEVFKNTLLTKLYWILFPIEALRQAVDMAKRILTKEKLDKQLTGQTSPFMSVRDGTDRRVSFNTREELGNKIDKLTMIMSKLAVKDNNERKPFKPQINNSRGQSRSYGQGGYQARSDNGNRGYSVNNSSRQNYRGNRFRGNFRGYGRQNNRDNYRNKRYGSNNRDMNRSRERTLTRNYGNGRDRSSSNDRSRSGSRVSTNRDRIRCYACREYDHFVRDCPNSREEGDLEQLQHMLNMEEQDHQELSTLSSDEDYRSSLNL